jgi:hypothetical protein
LQDLAESRRGTDQSQRSESIYFLNSRRHSLHCGPATFFTPINI